MFASRARIMLRRDLYLGPFDYLLFAVPVSLTVLAVDMNSSSSPHDRPVRIVDEATGSPGKRLTAFLLHPNCHCRIPPG